MPNECKRIVRYGTSAEQGYLCGDFLDRYDYMVLNANMVTHIRASLSKFLAEKCKNKPYFIDPLTHAFQHDLSFLESSSGEGGKTGQKKSPFKKSVVKLIEEYGVPVKSAVIEQQRPVNASDFKSAQVVDSFTERVLEFQREYLSSISKSADTSKYYKFLKKKGQSVSVDSEPSILIAPYFYIAPNSTDWLDVNIRMIRAARKQTSKGTLGAQIVINQRVLLDKTQRENVIEKYSKIEADWILVWIDGFVEQQASKTELEIFVGFLNELSKKTPLINLYGSFFSVACARLGILNNTYGVAHGMEHSESRPVIPVGGGIPVAKYYFPKAHVRLHFRDAVRAIRALGGFEDSEAFQKIVCNCVECRLNIGEKDPENDFDIYGKTKTLKYSRGETFFVREFPITETKHRCLRHYFYSKEFEYSASKYGKKKEILAELDATYKDLKSTLSSDSINHCKIWSEFINEAE